MRHQREIHRSGQRGLRPGRQIRRKLRQAEISRQDFALGGTERAEVGGDRLQALLVAADEQERGVFPPGELPRRLMGDGGRGTYDRNAHREEIDN